MRPIMPLPLCGAPCQACIIHPRGSSAPNQPLPTERNLLQRLAKALARLDSELIDDQRAGIPCRPRTLALQIGAVALPIPPRTALLEPRLPVSWSVGRGGLGAGRAEAAELAQEVEPEPGAGRERDDRDQEADEDQPDLPGRVAMAAEDAPPVQPVA